MKKTLVIMAAGIGNRYGGFKQMAPLGPSGEFIIDYSVYDAIRAGFSKVVFIISHDIEEEFKATIARRIGDRIEMSYSYQEVGDLPEGFEINPERTKPWGTVQAVLTCANLVNEPFAVINADDFYGRESYSVLSKYLDSISLVSTNYCMVGFKLNNTLSQHGTVTRGVCKSRGDGTLEGLVETSGIGYVGEQICYEDSAGNKKELNKDDLVSMNMWGFSPSIFELLKKEFVSFLQSHSKDLKQEFVIPTSVNNLIGQGEALVKVLSTSSDWFGITYPQDKSEVISRISQLIEIGEYPNNLWKGDVPISAEKRFND